MRARVSSYSGMFVVYTHTHRTQLTLTRNSVPNRLAQPLGNNAQTPTTNYNISELSTTDCTESKGRAIALLLSRMSTESRLSHKKHYKIQFALGVSVLDTSCYQEQGKCWNVAPPTGWVMRLLFHYGNCGQSNTRRTRHQRGWDGLVLFIVCDVS